MAFPDTWNYLKVAIGKNGVAYVNYASRIEDVDINEGDRPGRAITGCDGSCLWLDEPQETGEVTLRNIKPVSIDSTAAAGGLAQAYVGGTWDTSDPLTTNITSALTLARDDFSVVVLMTNDTANTGASAAVTAATQGLMFQAVHCRVTSRSCTGGGGKAWSETVTFKFAPMSPSNVRNYRWSSTNTAGWSALSTYAGADLS